MGRRRARRFMSEPAAREPTWWGQPRGLTILFLTNMWEQFSYFGMRALLVYYMTTTLLFDQEKSSSIYGFYTAFAYFTPIVGGVIADRWLGKKAAVIIGASVLFAYLMLPIPVYNTIWILLIAYLVSYLPYGIRFRIAIGGGSRRRR